jgi:hypothetical protein
LNMLISDVPASLGQRDDILGNNSLSNGEALDIRPNGSNDTDGLVS